MLFSDDNWIEDIPPPLKHNISGELFRNFPKLKDINQLMRISQAEVFSGGFYHVSSEKITKI